VFDQVSHWTKKLGHGAYTSTKIPCVLLCNYLLLHIFWEEFEPHNLHVFFFFSADFWPDRIHRSLPSRIIVAVVCLPTRWRSRDLMPKRARAHCRIDFRFLLPLPRLPLPADVSSHVVSVKVYGPRSVRKKKQRTRTTKKVKINWRRVADWDRHNLRVKPYFRLKVNSIHFIPEHWCHFNSSQEFQVFQNECRMSTTQQQPPPRKVFIIFQSIFSLSPLPIVM
jgi:hypothetical protein